MYMPKLKAKFPGEDHKIIFLNNASVLNVEEYEICLTHVKAAYAIISPI